MIENVYIVSGVRTPIGSFLGALADVSAASLGSTAVAGALTAAGVKPDSVDEVLMGNVVGAGQGQNIARQCSIGAGIPKEVGAVTVNKVCGSGMRTIILAAQGIQCGDIALAVAGGTESMSGAPYLLPKARAGYRMGHGQLVDAMIHDGLWDVYNDVHMGLCGDATAAEMGFSREAQDAYAAESYRRAQAAWASGFFKPFITPVEVRQRKATVLVEQDEDPAKVNFDKIGSLRPAFGAEGTVTAANASNINDGAAACVIASEARVKELGLKPLARILGHVNVATEPNRFTVAPVFAIRKLADKLSIDLAKVDLFEVNEAFSVVAMAAVRECKLDHARVNVNGGAVALGHPIGASGTRITMELAHSLVARDGKLGIAAICIGGGEATAIAIERC